MRALLPEPSLEPAPPASLTTSAPLRTLWPRLRADRAALAALAAVVVLVLLALLAPVIVSLFGAPGPAHRDPGAVTAFGTPTGPSGHHLLGVDDAGRDVLARLIDALRPALLVGLLGPGLALVLGTAAGALAGSLGGAFDAAIRGLVDALRSIPPLLLALALALACVHGHPAGSSTAARPGLAIAVIVVMVAFWPGVTRALRAETVALLGHGHVTAARAAGAPRWRVLREQVVPCLAAPALWQAAGLIPQAILLESALSFLGVGAHISWGAELAGIERTYDTAWWALVFPGTALLITVTAFAGAGRAVRTALAAPAR